jgi:hypothetical protein
MRLLLALLLLALTHGAPARAGCTAALTAGPVKVRPYGPAPAPLRRPLVCARNEYCSFQVVITAAGDGCRVDDVTVGDFSGVSTRLREAEVVVYRQGFLPVFYRSSAQGDLGEWPDPLIPRVDPEYGEPRNAFPVEVRLVSPAYRKYPARGGRPIPAPPPRGTITPGGGFTSRLVQRFILEIVQPGPVGQATFRWRSEPGRLQWSEEITATAAPVLLENGVTVSFGESEFTAGEYWIFAGRERRQPVWVDVRIPADAAAGKYSGRAVVKLADATEITLPVEIEVLGFALPATSSLPSYFGLYWPGVFAGHYGDPLDDAAMIELGQGYARAALRNAITSGGDGVAPTYEFDSTGRLTRSDYARFDAAFGPLLDGLGAPRGARWTSLRLPGFENYSGSEFAAAVRDFARHAREHGWAGRLFDVTGDEPRTQPQLQSVIDRARLLQQAAPEIPRLAATNLNPALFGLVTRWCPLVNHLQPKHTSLRQWRRNLPLPRRAEYDERLRSGDSLWWYQSCESHGCNGTGQSPLHDNWPSYMVDLSGAANRVFGLLTVLNHVGGILYWDMAYAHHYDPGLDGARISPWESLYHFGGNGDGSLFYPGTPERIGGTRHIAIESLRLKMIRDSLVDAEYALRLQQLGEEDFLRREAARVVQGAYRWSADPQAWLDLRERLARRLASRSQ